MTTWTRRKLLKMSAGAALGALPGCGKKAPDAHQSGDKRSQPADHKRDPTTTKKNPNTSRKAKLEPVTKPEAIATELLRVPRAEVCDRVTDLLANGSDREAVWNGIHRGMARFEGDVHPRLAALSMALVMRDLPMADQLLPLMWAADALKQEQSVGTKARPMPAVSKEVAALKRKGLIKRLHEAFAANDPVTCSGCLRELHGIAGQSVTAEQLYICAARDDRNGGHGTMYAVQGLRILDSNQWRNADRAIDSMMRHMLPPLTGQAPPGPGANEAYARQRDNAAKLASVTTPKKRDDGLARAVLHAARTLDGEALATEIGRHWATGNAPVTALWDGLVLAAAEQALNDASGARRGVHALDTVNVLHVASMRAASPHTRALLLLMAARRLPGFATSKSASPTVPIDALPATKRPADVHAVLADEKGLGTVAERAAMAARIAAWLGGGGDVGELKTAVRKRVVERAGMDWHQVKYPAAVLEEAAYAGSWAGPLILAAIGGCLPGKAARRWTALPRARAAIKRLRS